MLLFRYLYTLYSGVIFFLLTFLAFPVFGIALVLPQKQRLALMIGCARIWNKLWATLSGIHYRIVGKEHLQPNTQYIYTPNHTGSGDIFAVVAGIPGTYTALAKHDVSKEFPIIGFVISLFAVTVNRHDPNNRRDSVATLKQLGKQGISVIIFPEGTRNNDPNLPLKPFFGGAFRLAIDLKTPIVPTIILGARNLMNNNKLPISPCTITCIFGEPISPEGYTQETADNFKQFVFIKMLEMLKQHEPNLAHIDITEWADQFDAIPPSTTSS